MCLVGNRWRNYNQQGKGQSEVSGVECLGIYEIREVRLVTRSRWLI